MEDGSGYNVLFESRSLRSIAFRPDERSGLEDYAVTV